MKSSNILLDHDFEPHLTDFGIAKSVCASKSHTSTYVMGTIGYIDPEYARTSRLTEKSDVYSYGIVLLELLTGKKAVDNESNLHHLVSYALRFIIRLSKTFNPKKPLEGFLESIKCNHLNWRCSFGQLWVDFKLCFRSVYNLVLSHIDFYI